MGDFGYSDPKSISDIFKYSSGSVLFIDSNGVIAQDNAGLSFDPATGLLTVGGNMAFKSGTNFKGTFDHANTADRVYTLPNYDGQLATLAGIEALINKTIDADLNTITNIENADIKAGAGIVYSKLNLVGSIVNADIATNASISYSKLNLVGSIVNSDIASGASIAYSKLALTGSIVNSDIAAGAAIAYSKLNLANSIVDGDVVSITTRSKLPSQIAYEDEANTFSQDQTINADIITTGKIRPNATGIYLEKWAVNDATFLVRNQTSDTRGGIALMPNGSPGANINRSTIFLYSTDNELDNTNHERLTVAAHTNNLGIPFYYIGVERAGTGSLRPLSIQMDNADVLVFNTDFTIDFTSREISNFKLGNNMDANFNSIINIGAIQFSNPAEIFNTLTNTSAAGATSLFIANWQYLAKDSADNTDTFVKLLATASDRTSGAEDASYSIHVMRSGSLVTPLEIIGGGNTITIKDGFVLRTFDTTNTMFVDLKHDGTQAMINVSTGDFYIQLNGVTNLLLTNTIADGETALLVRRNVGGSLTLQRVSMGAADSGGSGYRVLRVLN